MSLKRILMAAVAVVAVGGGGLLALANRPAIAPIAPPSPASFPADQVARGAVLAAAGYCDTCHTAAGGQPYAGGYAMRTAFGTLYSTNITPDVATGIGAWSLEAFARALRDGVRRDGAHLFPAFPYEHFAKLSDADVAALYAYLMTRPAVVAPDKTNGLPFPLNLRILQAGWKLLFAHPAPFAPDPAHDAQWNRGAYLAEGLSHCSSCHTPRNPLGAEKSSRAYAGAVIDGWTAPPLTADNPSPAPWTADELAAYLRTGVSHYHGTAAGPMAPVVRGLAALPEEDTRAIAVYIASLSAPNHSDVAPAVTRALADEAVPTRDAPAEVAHGAKLYAAACAACHYNSERVAGGDAPLPLRPLLGLNSALHLDDPTNLIRVILQGIDAKDGAPGVVMPAFAHLSDADVAAIAAYLRATRAHMQPWPELQQHVAATRAEIGAERTPPGK